MDWYPLINSLRIAAVSCAVVFFLGILCAWYAAGLPRAAKGVLDTILTLPMVLPPTVCGYFLLLLFGVKRPLGAFLARFGVRFVMTWYGGVLAASAVAFPLMYRTARGAFESFDETLAYSAQTLGLSNAFIFWRIRMPACRQGILAGAVLAFARALGEYGATSMLVGYTPGKTATISTTVYQLWRTGDEAGALLWVLVNMAVSALTLVAVNMLEDRQKGGEAVGLQVRIRKKLGDFLLDTAFETDGARPEVMGLLGASGCGKSCTLKCIAGIERPDWGYIVLDGVTLFDSEKKIDLPPQKRRVGYLFQSYGLFPNMTVEQNILCGMVGEKNPGARKAELGRVLSVMQLEGLEGRRPRQLSGGQAQRVALARILVNRPRLLIDRKSVV